jgi:membrane protease YdiL (CAAX protease family)
MPVVAVAAKLIHGGTLPAAAVLIPVALAALVNGTAEEVFWRGALPGPDNRRAVAALALFVLFHFAPLAAAGVVLSGGWIALVGGALGLGTILALLRGRTGTAGAGALAHVAFNLVAFTDLALGQASTAV